MKGLIRIGSAAYLALICFIFLNLIFGAGGILSYNELYKYKVSLEENINQLEGINGGLIVDSNKLIHQSDSIKIQARELGWVEPNEGVIVLKGFNKGASGYTMGRLLSRDNNEKTVDYSNVLLAMLLGITFYIFSGFISTFRYRK